MSDLRLFLPITKVDAAQRLVYGVATAEQADRSNEICDYASTKPHYEKWSADIAQATQGKSLGNVRAMHGKVAAGKVMAITFNDAAKQIEIAAKIVDDAEWAKVQEGVYTGFSQGGAYEKRWQDPEDDKLMRYTARPSEVSLVDLPCLPGATFAMIKADGTEEKVPFVSVAKTSEDKSAGENAPPNEQLNKETPIEGDEWAQVWQSKRDGKTFKTKAELKKYHEQLDASAVADKVAESAMKALGELDALAPKKEQAEKRKFSSSERRADAESGAAEDDGSYPIENTSDLRNAIRAYGRSKNKAKTKAHIIARARALGATSMLPKGWAGSTKNAAWLTGELAKDVEHCARLCGVMSAIKSLRSAIASVDQINKSVGIDTNLINADYNRISRDIDDLLDELMAYDGPEDLLSILRDADTSGAIAKLYGAEFAELGVVPTTIEKADTSNSKADIEGTSEIEKLQANNAALIAKIDSMAETMTAIAARLKNVEDQPMPLPGAGAVRVISKAEDNGGTPENAGIDEATITKMLETPTGRNQLQMMLFKASQRTPMPLSR